MSYSSLSNLCDKLTPAQTNNRKFLPLDSKIYRGVVYNIDPVPITTQPVDYDYPNDIYPEKHAYSGIANPRRRGYRFYDIKTPLKRPEGVKFAGGGIGPDDGYKNIIEGSYEPYKESYKETKSPSCGSCGGKNENSDLFPLMNPRYNLREVTKQLILLEDHLNHVKKRCIDCIKKHGLFIEALMEEAIALDKSGSLIPMINQLLRKFRNIQIEFTKNVNKVRQDDDNFYCGIAQKIRNIRKPLMNNEEILLITA